MSRSAGPGSAFILLLSQTRKACSTVPRMAARACCVRSISLRRKRSSAPTKGFGVPSAEIGRDLGPEVVHPAPHGLVGNGNPAFGQQILDVAQAQGEPDIQPNRLLDDLRR